MDGLTILDQQKVKSFGYLLGVPIDNFQVKAEQKVFEDKIEYIKTKCYYMEYLLR